MENMIAKIRTTTRFARSMQEKNMVFMWILFICIIIIIFVRVDETERKSIHAHAFFLSYFGFTRIRYPELTN